MFVENNLAILQTHLIAVCVASPRFAVVDPRFWLAWDPGA